MGPLTEDLPEWSISSGVKVEDLKKKDIKPSRGGMADTALDSGFVLDGTITSPGQKTPPVHEGTAETGSLLDEGFSLPKQSADDTLQTPGDADGLISSLDAEYISSRGTLNGSDTLLSVPQEDVDTNEGLLDIPQERKKTEIAGQFLDDGGLVFEQPVEMPSKPRQAQTEELIFEPSLEQLMEQPEKPKDEEPEELYNSPSLEQLLEESSGVEQPLNDASGMEAAAQEHDAVEEHLGYLANSMKDWEQSENALSEAAAMLLNISGERSRDEEKEELQSLRQGLDNITASIHRMSASAREDMADVIEQTQRDNELSEAVQAETVTAESAASRPFGQESNMADLIEQTQRDNELSEAVQAETVTAESAASRPFGQESNMADLIEQTQRDNELSEAVQTETVTTESAASRPFGQEPNMAPGAGKAVKMRTLDPLDESASSGMDVDQILEKYKSSTGKTETAPPRQMSEQASEIKRQTAEQIRTAEQPAAGSKPVVMKTLTPLDEAETSGMNVNGIAELYKKPEPKRTKASKHESERKHIKASKQESEKKRVKAKDQEFETTVVPEGEESADGFRFVVDKGIVENPVEWRIDASFQSGGQDDSSAQSESAAEDENDVLTVSAVEDHLKKQEVEVKRRRVEKSRMENSSGFAYALSDLK